MNFSTGTTGAAAICLGENPVAPRGKSWSASSCCSKRRCRGCCRSGATGFSGGRRPRPRRRPARATSCGRGASVAIHGGPNGCPTVGGGAGGKLGYPRRAKRLHECATVIARDHGDVVPDDVEILLTLPGVGSYTARAIACFAYRQPVPVVDTNVRRVVARVVHGRADAAGASAVRDHADVSALLPDDDSAHRFSAALMELGAIVCTARTPRCGLCPVGACRWRQAGYPPADGLARRPQAYAGTDRQVRGRLLDVLRDTETPGTRGGMDVAWGGDTEQRERALNSLLADGLVVQTTDGRFALVGEGP